MDPIYIIAIVVGALIFILFCASIYVIAKGYRQAEANRAEQEAFYSDPKLAKMEYDIAYYDEETAAKLASSAEEKVDSQMTIDDIDAEQPAPDDRTAEEEAIFNKPEEGMEEIAGNYEPEKGEEE